jgi:hypothetical protein
MLRQDVQQLREKIELGDDSLAVELGFPKLLLEIENLLASENPNNEKLNQNAYGIFRLVTESYAFEQSSLGKQLLEIGTKIRDLSPS